MVSNYVASVEGDPAAEKLYWRGTNCPAALCGSRQTSWSRAISIRQSRFNGKLSNYAAYDYFVEELATCHGTSLVWQSRLERVGHEQTTKAAECSERDYGLAYCEYLYQFFDQVEASGGGKR